jgi:hypothetical protein
VEFLPNEQPSVELIRERHERLLERLRRAAEAAGMTRIGCGSSASRRRIPRRWRGPR